MPGQMPLVLLHGWGMGPSVFADWRLRLEAGRQVSCPAWSNHVAAAAGDHQDDPLDAIAARVAASVDRPAHWVGWSLGGLIALAAARRSAAAVGRVTLVAASPRMVAAPDWPGIDRRELQRFRRELQREPMVTHDRFLTLQARGSREGRSVLRALRRAVAVDGLPPLEVLLSGLDRLMQSDLRSDLDALSCPVDAVLGACDALVPATVAARLEGLSVPARVITGAGHAPFLSHPRIATDAIME
ncbi:MAG: alpha/beta fold hydrolase [Halofilum sp. (in: g-proteobacteria)]